MSIFRRRRRVRHLGTITTIEAKRHYSGADDPEGYRAAKAKLLAAETGAEASPDRSELTPDVSHDGRRDMSDLEFLWGDGALFDQISGHFHRLQQAHQAALNAEVLDRKAAYAQIVRLQEKVALSRQEIRALKDRLAAQAGLSWECGICGTVLADPDSCPDCEEYEADLAERLEKRSRQFPSLQGEYRLRRSQGAGAVDEGRQGLEEGGKR